MTASLLILLENDEIAKEFVKKYLPMKLIFISTGMWTSYTVTLWDLQIRMPFTKNNASTTVTIWCKFWIWSIRLGLKFLWHSYSQWWILSVRLITLWHPLEGPDNDDIE